MDRQEFVPIGEMEIGERVQTYHGETKRIASKLPRPGPPKEVYNLEVYGEHVYFVGEQAMLAHNMYNRLGLGREAGLSDVLDHGFPTYKDWNRRGNLAEDWLGTADERIQAFREASRRSDKILFNLDGVNVRDAIRDSRALRIDPGNSNHTFWELRSVLSSKELRSKTDFLIGGKVHTFDEFLENRAVLDASFTKNGSFDKRAWSEFWNLLSKQ